MKKTLLSIIIFSALFSLGGLVHAQGTLPTCGANCNLGYTPLEPIPGVTTGASNSQLSFPDLLNNAYKITIIIGALFAVLMLTVSGVRYMLSDVVTSKEKARHRITASLWGLLLIAASWLILNTINPQLTTFNFNPCPQGNCAINAPTPPPASGGSSVVNQNTGPGWNTNVQTDSNGQIAGQLGQEILIDPNTGKQLTALASPSLVGVGQTIVDAIAGTNYSPMTQFNNQCSAALQQQGKTGGASSVYLANGGGTEYVCLVY